MGVLLCWGAPIVGVVTTSEVSTLLAGVAVFLGGGGGGGESMLSVAVPPGTKVFSIFN